MHLGMWCHLVLSVALAHLLICPLSAGWTNTDDKANDLVRFIRDFISEGGKYSDLLEAKKWLKSYNDEYQKKTHEATLASWAYLTNITPENAKKMERLELENSKWLDSQYGEAKKFYEYKSLLCPRENNCGDVLRMLELILKTKSSCSPPIPQDAAKLASTKTSMQTVYASTTVQDISNPNKTMHLDPELTEVLATSKDYDRLLWAWKAWHDNVGPKVRKDFTTYVTLANIGAKDKGFSDLGEAWRIGNYETNDVEQMVDQLWARLKPIYVQLHAYVRRKLRAQYPGKNITDTIPAHLLGDMWAQQWTNIIDIVLPYKEVPSFDVTSQMVAKGYDPKRMFLTAEEFFTSLGLEPMTPKFWANSMITRPNGRTVECHGSAEDFFTNDDFRIKMCTEVNMEDLQTVHHEMGHIEYFMQYRHRPAIYRDGANAAFHEAVGDTIALSVMTPAHLSAIDLLADSNTTSNPAEDHKRDINFLMKMALEKVAFLPFALALEKWRWMVFRGEINQNNYNEKWWQLRREYQGISPPTPRGEEYFDPGCKYHVVADVPYIRYFLSFVGQFQFHRALCQAKGHTMELHKCDIYRSKAAGGRLMSMLSLGRSEPWPEAMFAITGQRQFDASAIIDYFRNLQTWLQMDNMDAQKKNDMDKPGWA